MPEHARIEEKEKVECRQKKHGAYIHTIHLVTSTAGENNGSKVDWMKEEERPYG